MAGLWLASAAGAAPLDGAPTDQIAVETQEDVLALSWSDAEERLQGSIRPAVPREGEPLQINLQVGSFEGEAFEGPLILTLREEGATHGQSLTVKKGAQDWQASFTPENDGPHLLDVSFRTTRHKVLHTSLLVRPSRLSLRLGWAVVGLGCLALLGYTMRGLLRGERPGEPPVPSDTPPIPATDTPPPPVPSAEDAPVPAAETPVAPSDLPGGDAPPVSEPPATPAPPAPAAAEPGVTGTENKPPPEQ